MQPHHGSPGESLRESHLSDDWIACYQLGWLVFETDGFRIRSVFIEWTHDPNPNTKIAKLPRPEGGKSNQEIVSFRSWVRTRRLDA